MRLLCFFLLLLIFSCTPDNLQIRQVNAYVPIYLTQTSDTAVGVKAVQATVNAGKIYAFGNYLFQVEQNEGIHIIDNQNPRLAQKIGFLKIPSASELAIKSGYLYTNHFNDLVVFDLASISSPKLVSRLANAFPQISQNYPPFTGVQFECPDPSKGVVIGWGEKLIESPKCRR